MTEVNYFRNLWLTFVFMVIGLTGGIGSGKSLVAAIIRNYGYPVFDADKEAKLTYETPEVIEKLINTFGENVFSNGKADFKKIASLVFNNSEYLKKLNSIIHPAVKLRFENWKKENSSEIYFREAAILIESGSYKDCDKIIFVSAPDEIRIKRVIARDQSTEESVKNRMKNQWSEEQLKPYCDFFILNDDGHALLPQVDSILRQIIS